MSAPNTSLYRRSSMDLFASCPFAFDKIHNHGVVDTNEPAIRGSSFHEVRIAYIHSLVEHQMTDDPQLLQQAMLRTFAEQPLPVHLMAEVEDLVVRWGPRFKLDLNAFLAAEMRLVQDEFEWRPDLVYAYDDELVIEDDKTYWSTFTDKEARDDFQANFYVWRAAKLWPNFPRYRFRFNFVRYANASAEAVWDLSEVDQVETRVRAIIAGIQHAREANHWPATPGRHCGYCNLECTAVNDPLKLPERYETVDDARQGFGEVLVLQRAIEARRHALQAFTDAHGRIETNGVCCGYKESIERRYPGAQVVEILRANGEPLDFTVAKTALSKFLTTQKRAHVRDQLNLVASEKTKSNWTLWTKEGDETAPI